MFNVSMKQYKKKFVECRSERVELERKRDKEWGQDLCVFSTRIVCSRERGKALYDKQGP